MLNKEEKTRLFRSSVELRVNNVSKAIDHLQKVITHPYNNLTTKERERIFTFIESRLLEAAKVFKVL